jgi:CUE domain
MSAPDPFTDQQPDAPLSGPSAPPPATSPPAPPSTPPSTLTAQNEIDPAIAPLVAMFPDFDPGVLEAVYLSNNRDQNAAIETLLSMSNPEVSRPRPGAAHTWTSPHSVSPLL